MPLRFPIFVLMVPVRMIRFRSKSAQIPAHNVLICGASGELGGALARHYATRGGAVMLWGRDGQRLEAAAQACRNAGARSVSTRQIDLTETDAAIAALAADDDAACFDLAIFAAGLGDIRTPGDLAEDPHMVARLGQVNFVAPAALASQLAGRMAARQRGGIVLIGSAAAFHALPFAAAYAGSKAGLARFAGALAIAMRPHGVRVTLASPGFIDTAAARRVPGPKPMAMSADRAAARIARAATHGTAHAVMPWPFALLRLIDRALPAFLRNRLLLSLTPPPEGR